MNSSRKLLVGAGSAAIGLYLCFALVAYAIYPGSFDPWHNWLSDLGNSLLNPSGAMYYRVGCAITGLLLVVFFLPVGTLGVGGRKRVGIYLRIAEGLGVVGGIALLLTGIFSEGDHASHSFWSAVLYIAFGTAVFLVGLAFLFVPGVPRSLSFLAFAITACDWVMSAFNKTHFIEWVVVTLMLVFVGALSFRAARWPVRSAEVADPSVRMT